MSRPEFTTSAIALTLRAEGLAIGLSAVLIFAVMQGSWLLFAVLILVPDLAMLGYLAGKKAGAFCYNCAHCYLGPVMLAGVTVFTDAPTLMHVALIWAAHIGLDRAIGYGLKYASGFKQTHLGRV